MRYLFIVGLFLISHFSPDLMARQSPPRQETEAALAFFREHGPHRIDILNRLKVDDPDLYRKHLDALVSQHQWYKGLKKQFPHQAETFIIGLHHENRMKALARKYNAEESELTRQHIKTTMKNLQERFFITMRNNNLKTRGKSIPEEEENRLYLQQIENSVKNMVNEFIEDHRTAENN